MRLRSIAVEGYLDINSPGWSRISWFEAEFSPWISCFAEGCKEDSVVALGYSYNSK